MGREYVGCFCRYRAIGGLDEGVEQRGLDGCLLGRRVMVGVGG